MCERESEIARERARTRERVGEKVYVSEREEGGRLELMRLDRVGDRTEKGKQVVFLVR